MFRNVCPNTAPLGICEAKHIEVVIINQGKERSFEEELAQDVLEIITVFSARLYGSRSHKNKKLIEAANAIMANANIIGLGIDTGSLDYDYCVALANALAATRNLQALLITTTIGVRGGVAQSIARR